MPAVKNGPHVPPPACPFAREVRGPHLIQCSHGPHESSFRKACPSGLRFLFSARSCPTDHATDIGRNAASCTSCRRCGLILLLIIIMMMLMFVVAEVTKKWNNLRSQFLREFNLVTKKKKSGSGAKDYVVKWRYYRHLLFLQPSVMNTKRRKSNITVCTVSCFFVNMSVLSCMLSQNITNLTVKLLRAMSK